MSRSSLRASRFCACCLRVLVPCNPLCICRVRTLRPARLTFPYFGDNLSYDPTVGFEAENASSEETPSSDTFLSSGFLATHPFPLVAALLAAFHA